MAIAGTALVELQSTMAGAGPFRSDREPDRADRSAYHAVPARWIKAEHLEAVLSAYRLKCWVQDDASVGLDTEFDILAP